MKIWLIGVSVLVLGSFQKTVCAAAGEAQNKQHFQEHKAKMGSVFSVLPLYVLYKGNTKEQADKIADYRLVCAGKDRAMSSYVEASEQALCEAFFICPSDRRKQRQVEFSGYCLDRAKLLAQEEDDLLHKIEEEFREGLRRAVTQISLTVRGRTPHFSAKAKAVSDGRIDINWEGKENLRARVRRVRQQQARLEFFDNSKKVEHRECKECE